MAWNTITVGSYTFTDAALLESSAHLSSTVNPDKLEYDTLTVKVNFAGLAMTAADLLSLPYGTAVTWSRASVMGKFYLSSAERVGKMAVQLNCVSAAGYLNNTTHYGGIYSGSTVAQVLADVIGAVVPYTVSADAGATTVYGWLPIGTRMSSLHQLLFAVGAVITKDASGNMVIGYPSDKTSSALPDGSFYYGATMATLSVASRVEVTEHSFYALPTDVLYTLFDNTDGSGAANGQLVKFDGCYHDITATGCTISDLNPNHMIVTGTGKVTGLKYTHTQRVLTKDNPAALGDNVVQVTDATLVSFVNSLAVLNRVYAYHTSAREIKAGILPGTHLPGALLSFTDPFDDQNTGYLQSMDVDMSHTLKADAVILCNYTPLYWGNNYSHVVPITADGTWTVPDGVNKISVVLIGGGSGGQSGGKGVDAARPTQQSGSTTLNGFSTTYEAYPYGAICPGGAAGAGGGGGKILRVDLDVTPGESFAAAIGAAGLGGAYSADGQNAGTAGAETTFGTYSSADGNASPNGFSDPFTGAVYGALGAGGVAGGDGTGKDPDDETYNVLRAGQPVTYNGVSYTPGASNITEISNTKTGNFTYSDGNSYYVSMAGRASYGCGGGAAVGANGADYSGNPSVTFRLSEGYVPRAVVFSNCAVSGNGADVALVPTAPTDYGCGGHGGHGGGGAGATGFCYGQIRVQSVASSYTRIDTNIATVPAGGAGCAGTDGAPGAVIVYY